MILSRIIAPSRGGAKAASFEARLGESKTRVNALAGAHLRMTGISHPKPLPQAGGKNGVTGRHVFLDFRHRLCNDAISRSPEGAFAKRIRKWGGMRCPRAGLAGRARAASGIMLAGTRTGPGGAFPGLGQAGAVNDRVSFTGA